MRESPYLKNRDDLIGTLRKIPFLSSYEIKFLRKILELSKLRIYGADEIITRQGEYDTWLYVILSGEVRVVKDEEEIARLDAQGRLALRNDVSAPQPNAWCAMFAEQALRWHARWRRGERLPEAEWLV